MKKLSIVHGLFSMLFLVVVMTTSTSHSGGNSSNTPCSSCHGSGAPGSISVTGVPSSYVASQTYNLTLCVTDNTKPEAGFRLQANGGVFSNPGANAQIQAGKLIHSAPTLITSGNACWTGDWTAPTSGTILFEYHGNAVNGNNSNDPGDNGGYQGFIANVSLPVTFGSFDLQKVEERIFIDWTTTSEVNNDYFDIEWSTDGKRFTSISHVEGAGDFDGKSAYSFRHNNPSPGMNYYRIVQQDYNGQRSSSEIKSVEFQPLSPTLINTVANPYIYFSSGKIPSELDVVVYNQSGQIILQTKESERLDFSSFKTGYYFVQIRHNRSTTTRRIFKL